MTSVYKGDISIHMSLWFHSVNKIQSTTYKVLKKYEAASASSIAAWYPLSSAILSNTLSIIKILSSCSLVALYKKGDVSKVTWIGSINKITYFIGSKLLALHFSGSRYVEPYSLVVKQE